MDDLIIGMKLFETYLIALDVMGDCNYIYKRDCYNDRKLHGVPPVNETNSLCDINL
jgi:hypothetical protein